MAVFSERIALTIDAKTSGATAPLGQLQKQAKATETSFDKMAKSVGLSSATLKAGLVAGATALIGTGLVQFLNDSVSAYADGAKAASDLANATGGTVDEVSRLTAALEDAGVSAQQTAGLLTKFTTAASSTKGSAAIEALGVSLIRTASGATDYAASMVVVVDAIGEIGDASQRNAALVSVFGKAGAAAFRDLYNSGIKLGDAMAVIDKYRVFTPADVRAAMEYDDAMDSLHASAQTLQFAIGRALVPALSDLAKIITPVVNTLAGIDTGTFLFAGAAIAVARWGQAFGATLAAAGGSLATFYTDWKEYRRIAVPDPSAEKRTIGLTTAVIGVGIAWEVASRAIDSYTGKLEEALAATTTITDETARQLEQSMSWWQALGAAIKDTFSWEGLRQNLSFGGPSNQDVIDSRKKDLEELKRKQDELTEAQGPAAVAAKAQGDAQKELNNLLASGAASQGELATAVANAAEAQHTQEVNTNAAKDAMAAYAAATWDAVEATLAQIDKNYAQNRAVRDYHEQVKETAEVLADSKKSQEEQNQSLDDLGLSALAAGRALVELKTQEALLSGEVLSTAQKNDILLRSLRERKREASTKQERHEIQLLIDKLEGAQATAGAGVLIGDIRFKSGTTEEQVQGLKDDINAAFSRGDISVAIGLQEELNSLLLPDLTQTVSVVGPDGQPLQDPKLNVQVTTEGVDSAKAAIAGLPSTVDVKVKVNLDLASYRNALVGAGLLSMAREVVYKTTVPDYETTMAQLNRLDDDRTAKYNVKLIGVSAAKSALDALSRDRYTTIHVNYATTGTAPSSRLGGYLSGSSGSSGSGVRASSASSKQVSYSPTIVNNYPKAERASDSIAMSLRLARYSVGA